MSSAKAAARTTTASDGNAKALVGVLFLQYCSYAIFYLLDEMVIRSPSHFYPLIDDGE